MDEIRNFKEQMINDYISQIDYDNIDTNLIRRELRQMLGEEPNVHLVYNQEMTLLEDGKSQQRLERLEGLEVTFTYEKQVLSPTGQLMDIPVPVTLKYRLL